MRWFKEVWIEKTQFLIEKGKRSGKFYVDISFYLRDIQYLSSNRLDTELEMDQEFNQINEEDCQDILGETKASLN